MLSTRASFTLAVVFLLGVHKAQAQAPEIEAGSSQIEFGTGTHTIPIGEPLCVSVGDEIVCRVKDCSLTNLSFMWTHSDGMPISSGVDGYEITETDPPCMSTLRFSSSTSVVPTDITCTVTADSGTDSATTYAYTGTGININFTHYAQGIPAENIQPTSNTRRRIGPDVSPNALMFPFLNEVVTYECEYGFATIGQLEHFVETLHRVTCLSTRSGNCRYYMEESQTNATIIVTMSTYLSGPLDCIGITGTTDEDEDIPVCGHFQTDGFGIVVHDPARIHDYTETGSKISVTRGKYMGQVGESVIICCNVTGIHEVTVNWLDGTGMVIDGQTSLVYVTSMPEEQPDVSNLQVPGFGVSCLQFTLTRETAQNYTCSASNDVIDPPGENETISICLPSDPPIPHDDQNLCVDVDAGQVLSLDCTPLNMQDGDEFTYQWSGPLGPQPENTSSIMITDPGSYTCVVTNSAGEGQTEFNVTAVPSALPIISVTDSEGTPVSRSTSDQDMFGNPIYLLQVGDNVNFTCENTRGEEIISLFIPENIPISEEVLIRTNVSAQNFDNGTYRCTVGNPENTECSPDTARVVFRVIGFPPEIPPPRPPPEVGPLDNETVDIGLENICITEGASVTLFCDSPVGTQPINYFWLSGNSMSSTPIGQGRYLTVMDAGAYTCVANNSFGQDNATSNVIFPPQATLTVTVTGGTRGPLSDTCSTLLEPPPPDVQHCPYVGEDIEICCSSDIATSINILTHPNVTSMGGKITYSDTVIPDYIFINGEYVCNTSVVAGCADEVRGTVRLYDPARINTTSPLPPSTPNNVVIGIGRHPDPVPVAHGTDVSIYCPYIGLDDPTPRTVFTAIDNQGNEVPGDQLPSPKYTIELQNSTYVLVISDYTAEDLYHTFRCDTRNQAGEDTQEVTLIEDHAEWCCDAYGQCDMNCHLGVRTRNVYCCQRDTRIAVEVERCNSLPMPPTNESCKELGPCRNDPVWIPQPWSECSVSCGGGYRIRELACMILGPGDDPVPAPDGACDNLPRPPVFEFCSLESCCQADLYKSYCKLIASTSLCNREEYQEICCWTCQTFFYN